MKLIELAMAIAYDAKVNYEDNILKLECGTF